jgi:hypothetical protein
MRTTVKFKIYENNKKRKRYFRLPFCFSSEEATLAFSSRAANDSIWSESDLAQTRFIKVQVELSRVCETFRTEKSSSSSICYYSN